MSPAPNDGQYLVERAIMLRRHSDERSALDRRHAEEFIALMKKHELFPKEPRHDHH